MLQACYSFFLYSPVNFYEKDNQNSLGILYFCKWKVVENNFNENDFSSINFVL